VPVCDRTLDDAASGHTNGATGPKGGYRRSSGATGQGLAAKRKHAHALVRSGRNPHPFASRQPTVLSPHCRQRGSARALPWLCPPASSSHNSALFERLTGCRPADRVTVSRELAHRQAGKGPPWLHVKARASAPPQWKARGTNFLADSRTDKPSNALLLLILSTDTAPR
jgi:hypothetical protein